MKFNEYDPDPATLGLPVDSLLARSMERADEPTWLKNADNAAAERRAIRAGTFSAALPPYHYVRPKAPVPHVRHGAPRLAPGATRSINVAAEAQGGATPTLQPITSNITLPAAVDETPPRSTGDKARDHVVHFVERSPILIALIAVGSLIAFIFLTALPSLFESKGGAK